MNTTTEAKPEPKSYLTEEERARALTYSQDYLYMKESMKAEEAGDIDSSWRWLAKAEHPAHFLMAMKKRGNAYLIRKWDFNTKLADEAYGPGWLDREYSCKYPTPRVSKHS